MLKKIPRILSPELMCVLMEMGHGDEIVLADANFPAASLAQRLVRADGLHVRELMEAILPFFPLDSFVPKPAVLMQVVAGHDCEPVTWSDYLKTMQRHEPEFTDFEFIERFAFYERANHAYAVVATGETALYSNIILKKGVVVD
jgi:L-fucose mutarotase